MKVELPVSVILIVLALSFLPGSNLAHAQEDYQEWLQKQQEAFQQFKEKRDNEFAEFLEKQWRNMGLQEGVTRDEKPKPFTIPQAEQLPPRKIDVPDRDIIKDIPVPKYVPLEIPEFKKEPVPPVDIERGKAISFDYFGVPVTVRVDKGFSSRFGQKIDNKAISKHWQLLSNLDYEKLLLRVRFLKEQMQLNDWGYGLLLDAIAAEIYPTSQNDRNLFLWFMLSKSGYRAKIGYQEDHIYLLLPFENPLYGKRNFTIDGSKFYLIDFDGRSEKVKSLYTYDGRYPGAEQLLSLKIEKVPSIRNLMTSKELSFSYGTAKHTFSVKYNETLMKFFERYPQTSLEVYFEAPVSPHARYSLLNSLKPVVAGKSETEAANILLRFVQTAFGYKTDGEQFGREKFFFAEETLFYPYSDCEDRSILFAYLVRSLLGLEVIGLDYPGHIATAVHFNGEVDGEYVMHGNKRFVICDPTYINAVIGMRMPTVKKPKPGVIFLTMK